MTPANAPIQPRTAWLFGVLATAFVYLYLVWPAVHGPFIFDDFPNLSALAKNGLIDSWSKLGIYLSEARSFPGRPLAMLSFVPQQASWPDNPMPFKVINLALHFLNAGLLFLLLRTVSRAMWPGRERALDWVAAVAALAWLIQPMQLSAVLLVIQRMTLLSTFFTLIGLLAYCRGLLAHTASPTRRALWMGGGVLLGTVLATLCKETGLLLPFYAWAIDATLLRNQREALPRMLSGLRKLLLWPPIIFVLAFLLWNARALNAPIATRDFTLAERLLTEGRVLFDYLVNIAIPAYGKYSVYHDDFVASRGLLDPWTTLPALLGVLLFVVIAAIARRRWPLLAFAILWFGLGHILESGPIALELYFEHRNYLPMAGPLFAIFAGLAMMAPGRLKIAAGLLAGVWMMACLLASTLVANVWSDPARLAYFNATSHPASIRAQGDYAEQLYKAGKIEQARSVMAAVAQRHPQDAGITLGVMFLDCSNGALGKKAVADTTEKLRRSAWSRLTFEGLDQLRVLASSKTCPVALDETAWLAMSDALLTNPAFRSDPIAMGTLHYQRHSLAVSRGDLATALSELDLVASHDPDPEIPRLKAKYLMDAGLADAAIDVLEHYDPTKRPLLRRLLVDDVQLNQQNISAIRARAAASPPSG